MGYAADQIVAFVREYLDANKELLRFDRTIMAKVISVGTTTAVVESSGREFTCRIKDGVDPVVGEVVIVKIPNNHGDHKYIDGKLKK